MKANVFGDALWLWAPNENNDERDRRVRFRKVFELKEIPEKFEALVTADAYYTLYVNGVFVHHGPARNIAPIWSFDRIDLAPFLQKGRNVIAVLGYQYGLSNYSYIYEDASGFLMRAPGIKTDSSWKMKEDPGYIRAVAKGSGQYCFQEFFDCRQKDGDWTSLEYDDSSWLSGSGRIAGVMPWHTFEERGIPLLSSQMTEIKSTVSASAHVPAENWRALENILTVYHREKPSFELPEKVKNPTCVVYDFGREVVGMLHFVFEADDALDFMVCEACDHLVPRFSGPGEQLRCFGGRLIPQKGVKNEHELTLPWGFRYLVIFNRGRGHFHCKASVREFRYPLDCVGKFHSSDALLNRIWEISEHTQKCCMADAYIDCPSREYAQWWGDALVQSQNTFRLAADARLLERGLRMIGRQRTPDGLTYGLAPGCAHSCILPDYSAMYLVTLEADYFQTGSLAMWRELRNVVSGIIHYFESEIGEDGVVPFDPRYWLFIDWCPELDKIETYNLIILWGLQSTARLAELSREDADEILLNRICCLQKKLLRGIQLKNPAPHAAAFAILLDLKKECHSNWIEKILLPLLAGSHDAPIQPGPYFMYYVFEALKKYGYRREILDCIRRWWGEYVENGYSTTPEQYLEESWRYSSMCHAWSAHPLKHFSELLLGVRQTAPGWREIIFEPCLQKGMKVSGQVPTPYGVIQVYWDWSGEELHKNIILPPGVRCISKI